MSMMSVAATPSLTSVWLSRYARDERRSSRGSRRNSDGTASRSGSQIVGVVQVVELRSVDDLRLAVERAVLVKLQVSEVAELVERDDVGDFSGFFGYATDDLPIRRNSSRRP